MLLKVVCYECNDLARKWRTFQGKAERIERVKVCDQQKNSVFLELFLINLRQEDTI